MDKNTARVERLRAMIPYLEMENNSGEIAKIKKEIRELTGDYFSLNDSLANNKLNSMKNDPEDYFDRAYTAIKENRILDAKEIVDEGIEKYPFSKRLLYMLASVRKGEIYKFTVTKDKEHTEAEKLDIALTFAMLDVFRDDPEICHRIFCAKGEYDKAREIHKEAAEEAMSVLDYDTAAEKYRKAIDFDMADKVMAEKKIYDEYTAEIGDPKTYIKRKLDEKCGQELSEHNRLYKITVAHPKAKSWPCVIAFIISFVISLFFNFNDHQDKTPVAIGFSIAFAVGYVLMAGEGFKFGKTLLTTIITFLLTAAFNRNIFWELIPILDKVPDAIIINIVSFIAAAVNLVRKINSIPGERAMKKLEKLTERLKNKRSEIKDDLYNRYAPRVGDKRAKEWIKRLTVPSI